MLEYDTVKVNQVIGIYLHNLFGCNIRFRYLKDCKGICVEVYYPKKFAGIRVGIPAEVLKDGVSRSPPVGGAPRC